MLQISIDGEVCGVIVDTGANFNTCDRAFVEKHTTWEEDKDESEMTSVLHRETVQSATFQCMMQIVDIDGNNHEYLLEGTAMDMSELREICKSLTSLPIVGLISTEWLEFNHANIDVWKKTIKLY